MVWVLWFGLWVPVVWCGWVVLLGCIFGQSEIIIYFLMYGLFIGLTDGNMSRFCNGFYTVLYPVRGSAGGHPRSGWPLLRFLSVWKIIYRKVYFYLVVNYKILYICSILIKRNIMTATFEIIKGQIETVNGLQSIIEVMHSEGIKTKKLADNRIITVYGNGTYEINS